MAGRVQVCELGVAQICVSGKEAPVPATVASWGTMYGAKG